MNQKELISRAMAVLGRRNLGKKKTLSAEESARRSARIKAQIDAGKMRRGPAKAKP